jgi:hypothetical protein
MAFGQSSGPPASGRQIQELLALLNDAGHVDFRDARGPMGFTQRQAGGKFTSAEADEFIEQLQQAAYDNDASGNGPSGTESAGTESASTESAGTQSAGTQRAGTESAGAQPAGPRPRLSAADKAVQAMPTERLAAELQRRGWIVIEP